ncbi:MAG: phosphatidate cytidylyltransferase [Bacteroidota bacterium]|nr:phosphatidate cytidylyltransferase [Bacteroidota bacterium]
MDRVIYYTIFFIVLGGIGMAVANRKAETVVRRQRWTKYFMYILITGTVITSIFLHFFYCLSWIIVLAAAIELGKVNIPRHVKRSTAILSFGVFLPVATGFICFAKTFNEPFLLFIYFQVLVFDGFCQVTGQLFGRHPLAPKISPTKTWEGLAGGWWCCMIAAILAAGWLKMGFVAIYFGLLCGVLTGLVSLWGDLLASFYKRKVQVKDYSNWLPGQGGFLDRFDSFLLTGAVYYWVYILIFKEGFSEFIKQAPA